MGQKTSHIRGIRAALAAAGSTVHPALVPGSTLWLWALAAAVLFGTAGCPTWGPPAPPRWFRRKPAPAGEEVRS
jgi:hypothetical protein